MNLCIASSARSRLRWPRRALAVSLLTPCLGALASSPYASEVVSYTPGTGIQAGFTNSQAAIGEPSRYTADGAFSGAVTPFNAPYKNDQIVSVGAGGSLVLKFDHPVTNDPQNPYGIDLLVFGNSFFYDPATFGPTANALYGGRGQLEVSQNGTSWTLVPNFRPDGAFPTLGYNDVSDPYSSPVGASPTDFTRPVNPALDWHGMGLAEVVAGYAGSGGGAGVDIGALGLSSIQYLRFTVPAGETAALNIDGVADVAPVPSPASLLVLGVGGAIARRRVRNT
jgi:hypothetical protein